MKVDNSIFYALPMNYRQPSTPPSIPISYTRMIARQLGLQEKELNNLMWKTGLNGNNLTDSKTLLTEHQQYQILRNALRLSKNPSFGLQLGQLLTPPTHGQIGFLANSSPNLMSALETFKNFLPNRMSLTHLKLTTNGDWLECHLDIKSSDDHDVYRCLTECFSLSLISLIEFILGCPFSEGHFYFNYPEPIYHNDYDKFFSCPYSFDEPECKLLIPLRLSQTHNISSDHVNYDLALRQCQSMLQELDDSDNTSNQVKTLLLSHPPGQLSEQEVADILFISKRTLSRRLNREGNGFRILRDDILSSMAMNYLQDTTLSVEAIASLLNYHDSSNFRRAFKRWHQQTPESFRNK